MSAGQLPPNTSVRAYSDAFSESQTGSTLPLHATAAPRRRSTINYFLLPNLIVHVVCLAGLLALWYYLRFTNVFPYHHRVFYCRDILLFKPKFRPEDFEVYVSDALLYVLGFFLPPIIICIGEVMFWLFSTKPRKVVYATCRECSIHLITRRLVRFLSVFLFGALITQIFVDVIKLLTGYQRPYFLSLCNVSFPACTAPLEHSPSPSPHLACLNRDADELRYAWLSFPSLHAAFSSYSACFASCYIYYMINVRGAPLLRPMFIFGLLALALLDAMSRLNGYKNHWRDIWVGWLIGFAIALFLCYSVLCFQEVYHVMVQRQAVALRSLPATEEKPSWPFAWFRIPRINAPSLKEDEEDVVYEKEILPESRPPQPQRQATTVSSRAARNYRGDADRVYESTTTTESFRRTIAPLDTSSVRPTATVMSAVDESHYHQQQNNNADGDGWRWQGGGWEGTTNAEMPESHNIRGNRNNYQTHHHHQQRREKK